MQSLTAGPVNSLSRFVRPVSRIYPQPLDTNPQIEEGSLVYIGISAEGEWLFFDVEPVIW